ncbi:MAG: YqaJ viral recombinase family protein [Candidatus Saccharibacteria bacterium]|nr:YqaJ viral recombinase family protein [Candidatus Saccharibacteria bacterium]
MKVIKLQQNSEEWLEFRKGKSGGSEFKDLWIPGLPLKAKVVEKLEEFQPLPPADKKLTVKELAGMLEPEDLAELKLEGEPKKRFYEIVAERVARPITPNDYVEQLGGEPFSMMARGHILEPEALAAFEEKTGKKIDKESVVWVSDYDESAYVSPDGCITSEDGKVREACEVKCLGSAEIVKIYAENHYPTEYEPQVLKYFMVNEDLEVLHFIVYTDVIPGLELQIFDIKREDVDAKLIEAKAFEKVALQRINNLAEQIENLSF